MSKKCPIEATLNLINGKWKLLIFKALSQASIRYGALEKAIPTISAKVLTQQLREMEKDGLIIRTIYPEVPPRVEYRLSEKGVSIFAIFVELRRWGLEGNQTEDVECVGCFECQPSIFYRKQEVS